LTIDPRHILIGTLNESDLSHIDTFDCSDDIMNAFLKTECFKEQEKGLNKTYVLYYKGELAAFCSICADKINLGKDEQTGHELPRGSVPAVKVARLGRDKRFAELRLGRMLLDYVRMEMLELSQKALGIRFITLDAYEHRVPYYSSIGFVRNSNQGKNSPTVSMRLDIFEGILNRSNTQSA
jgi:predicted GNAT family N-acyltransferase